MKLCKDCVYRRRNLFDFLLGFIDDFSRCDAPQNLEEDPVTGGTRYKSWRFCSTQRKGESNALNCGEIGSWFKGKQAYLPVQEDKETPAQSPIIDPFGITPEQQKLAAERSHYLHSQGKSLDEVDVLYAITAATVDKHWASRGYASAHWHNISARAIAQLQQLGFRDNADVQRYLDCGELPDVST